MKLKDTLREHDGDIFEQLTFRQEIVIVSALLVVLSIPLGAIVESPWWYRLFATASGVAMYIATELWLNTSEVAVDD